jgi:hypothetical protein
MKSLLTALLFILCSLPPSFSFAFISPTENEQAKTTVQNQSTIQIGWQDLQGKVAPYFDPFRELTQEQIYHLSIYGRVLEIKKEHPNKVNDEMKVLAEEAKAKLLADHIDIEYLFAQRQIIAEKRKQAAMAINPLIVSRHIEISGYLLALEFDQGLVTEFLLVPSVGDCSHKPAPPANQLILVKTQHPFKAGSSYMPIRVTGTLQTMEQSKNLYVVDGNKDIQMAYFIDDGIITPF